MKRQITDWDHISVNYKGLASRRYKEPSKLNSEKTNNLLRKWTEDTSRQLTKKGMQMKYKHMKRCSISLVTREMNLKVQ